MKSYAISRRRNFSLIEVLTVIAIIGVLSAIVLGLASLARTRMAESRTRATIEKVSLTLNSLQAKFGYYPNATNGMLVICGKDLAEKHNWTAANWKKEFVPKVTILGVESPGIDLGGYNGSKSIYPAAYLNGFVSIIEFENLRDSCIWFDGQIVLADAMEHPLVYMAPGHHNTGTFDLASAGVDGNVGNKEKSPNVPFALVDGGELKTHSTEDFDAKTSDDITNF